MIKKINEDLKENEGFLDEPEDKPPMISSKDANVPIQRFPPGYSGDLTWSRQGVHRLKPLQFYLDVANKMLNYKNSHEKHKKIAQEFIDRVEKKDPRARNLIKQLTIYFRYLNDTREDFR